MTEEITEVTILTTSYNAGAYLRFLSKRAMGIETT